MAIARTCSIDVQPRNAGDIWGLDLAGLGGAAASGDVSLQNAGGIGGLLAVHQAQGGGGAGRLAQNRLSKRSDLGGTWKSQKIGNGIARGQR